MTQEKTDVSILLVNDQPAGLAAYEAMLAPLGEIVIEAASAEEALGQLLRADIAVILIDVGMSNLDGFELAATIRKRPRLQRTPVIFIAPDQISEADYLRAYGVGAADFVPVPVVPEVLRAKARVFVDLYRKTRELERLNHELERRINERTAALESSSARLQRSERGRSLALAAGNMGSWEYDATEERWSWDEGHCRIFGLDPQSFNSQVIMPAGELMRSFFSAEDWSGLQNSMRALSPDHSTFQRDFRIVRADGKSRSCVISAAATFNDAGKLLRIDGVTLDITDRKEATERHALLAREVDHRARNALAIVQAIVRLARADTTPEYIAAVEGRIRALAQTHELLSQARWQGADLLRIVNEEIAPYRVPGAVRVCVSGPSVILPADKAQILALSLHELATNAAKFGALSNANGEVRIEWELAGGKLRLNWEEFGGPETEEPARIGFGLKLVTASLRQQPGGAVGFDWRPGGLVCRISFDYGRADSRDEKGSSQRDELRLVALKRAGRPRVLLVEDEALVGLMLRDLLEEAGWNVSGTISSLPEALQLARDSKFDAAVLDVNLGGVLVYPLAELLQSQGVPFVFLTGYAQEQLAPRFLDAPVLQKPIEAVALETALGMALARPSGGRLARQPR